MKVVVISLNDPNIYPALHHLAFALAERGAEVEFLSTNTPNATAFTAPNLTCSAIPRTKGLTARVPLLRANYHGIFNRIRRLRPDWMIAQHEYILPALAYKASLRGRDARVAGYFSDYHKGRWHTEVLKRLAPMLDASVDVCDVRVRWRQDNWPKMRADCFVVRQAPHTRRDAWHVAHSGPARAVFTGSRYVLGLDQERLGRFLARLCKLGVSVDWYLPGPDQARIAARSLCSHPLYSVCEPIGKAELLDRLSLYDVGLHWAPMAESDHDPDYFQSAASNKIGEYIAAGLLVAHAGNPGLTYLPDDVCVVFDPTDPEQGAEQLVAALGDRGTIERKRAAALRYHLEEMNFDEQASRFVNEVFKQKGSRDGRSFSR